jgi:hypothetical protein
VGGAAYFVADARAYADICAATGGWPRAQEQEHCELCQAPGELTECCFCLRCYHPACIRERGARPRPGAADELWACPQCRSAGRAQPVQQTTAPSRVFLGSASALGLGVIRRLPPSPTEKHASQQPAFCAQVELQVSAPTAPCMHASPARTDRMRTRWALWHMHACMHACVPCRSTCVRRMCQRTLGRTAAGSLDAAVCGGACC